MPTSWEFVEQDLLPNGTIHERRRLVFVADSRDEAMDHALYSARLEYPGARVAPSGLGIDCGTLPDGTIRSWYLTRGQ